MQLSIIIVSWNVKNLLKRNLESIFKFTQNFEFEVIVVDNNSTDGTQEMLRGFNKVIRIENSNNEGFSKANNQGLAIAKGGYVAFMNPDMELIEDSFSKLFAFAKENATAGLIA